MGISCSLMAVDVASAIKQIQGRAPLSFSRIASEGLAKRTERSSFYEMRGRTKLRQRTMRSNLSIISLRKDPLLGRS
jgi:hypothetical protein